MFFLLNQYKKMNRRQYTCCLKGINDRYEFLRHSLFNLIVQYIKVKHFYISYNQYIITVEKKYPTLFYIIKNQIKTFYISKLNYHKINKKQLFEKLSQKKISTNVVIMIGESQNKYKCIKYIMNKIIQYSQELYKYLLYLENCIIRIVNGMNNFVQIYSNIVFDSFIDNSKYLSYSDQLILVTLKSLSKKI